MQYGVDEGLPGSQVYDIVQDSRRYLWVATDLGLCRFDGNQFENFTTGMGLPEAVILRLAASPDGSLLLLGASRRVYQFKDHQFSHVGPDSALHRLLGNALITSLSCNNRGDIALGLLTDCDKPAYHVEFDGGLWKAKEHTADFYSIPFGNSGIYGGLKCGGKRIQLGDSVIELTQIIKAKDFKATGISPVWSHANRLYRGRELIQEFRKSISKIFEAQDVLVVAFPFFGASALVKNKRPFMLNQGRTLTAFCRDHEGGIWVGTLSDGLLYYRDLEIYNLKGFAGRDIIALKGHENQWMAADAGGKLEGFFWNSDSGFSATTSAGEGMVSDIVWDGNFLKLSEQDASLNRLPEPAISMMRTGDTLWFGQTSTFSVYKGNRKIFDGRKAGINTRVNGIVRFGGEVWLGSINGLWRWNKGNPKKVDLPKLSNAHIQCLSAGKHTLAIGTYGAGVMILGTSDTTYLDSRSELPSDFISDVAFDENDALWIATNKGMAYRPPTGKLIVLNKRTGLPHDEIKKIALHSQFVLLATRKGITVVEKNYFSKKVPLPQVLITSKSGGLDDKIPYGTPGLKAMISATTFRNLGHTRFRYRVGQKQPWEETTQRELLLPTQPSGALTLEVQAMLNGGDWGPENRQISYIVSPPLSEKWWVWLLGALFVFLVGYLVFWWAKKQSEKRNAVQMEIQSLKLKALSAQMNPHFIFNSLNSIQRFLLDNDVRNSNKYLAKFANLMRLILNNSSYTFVGISEVVQVLTFYMELEQLRFGNKFQFQINVDPAIDLSKTRVPPMLIQPFAENAILHGILPLEDKPGEVIINIKAATAHALKCTVTDNGVGREFHVGKLEKAHKSKGLEITKERLGSYGMYTGVHYEVLITDLCDAQGNSTGTQVMLDLPYTAE
jgi:hypothetical protein